MRSVSTCHERRGQTRALDVAIIVALCVVSAPAAASQAVFRSATAVVALPVLVVDEQHRSVPNLRREDFAVFEEGIPQTVSLFAAGAAPLDLMLLLDTSSSMHVQLPTVKRAAIGLLRTLGPADRAAVVLFNDDIRVAHALSGDLEAAAQAVSNASASGRTALYEALYVGLKELARATRGGDEVRRQALVMLTDGADTSSHHVALDDVREFARAGNMAVYAILPPDARLASQPLSGDRPGASYGVRMVAEETGGRAFTPRRAQDIPATYEEIARELREQYWLAYVPTLATRGFRRIAVRIPDRPALRARTRSGYYATLPRLLASPAPRPPR
jgi:Ca-activated chloride channel family protein